MREDLHIVGVAYRLGDGGAVISMGRPNRHHNILSECNYNQIDGRKFKPEDSGFLLSDGTFATRRRAFNIAVMAGQLLERKPGQYDGPELYSEDLW